MLDAIWTLVGRLNRGATDRNRFRFDLPEKSRTHRGWPRPSLGAVRRSPHLRSLAPVRWALVQLFDKLAKAPDKDGVRAVVERFLERQS
jgi:hypothetical protein